MLEQVLALLVAAAVVMGTPGPSTLSATAVGAGFGFRRALPYVAGLVLGTVGVLLAVVAGVVGLLVAVPEAALAMAILSAAYIVYLAYRVATAPPLAYEDAAVNVPTLGAGVLLALANPKAWLAISAVVAGSTLAALPKLALLVAMVVGIHLLWLLAGASLARFLHVPAVSRGVNIVLALALVASAALALF
jgi:threonine/homoserine/homoserine lactone efflux protein